MEMDTETETVETVTDRATNTDVVSSTDQTTMTSLTTDTSGGDSSLTPHSSRHTHQLYKHLTHLHTLRQVQYSL